MNDTVNVTTNTGDDIIGTISGTLTDTAGSITTTSPYYYDESSSNINAWKYISGSVTRIIEKGDDNMRYLYEVILVNPKDDEFEVFELVARSETAALMFAYGDSDFNDKEKTHVDFDDLETQCRILMSWKKKKSLEKALETIKKAVE